MIALPLNLIFSRLGLRAGRKMLFFFPLLILVACSSPGKSKKIRIGFSQCIGSDLWRKTMLDEMKREISFHNDIEFIYKDADGNSQKQIGQIEDLEKEHIDLLIVSPNEINPLTPIIEKVYDAGIPVVVIDRTIQSNKYSAFVGASNFEVGQNAGKYAVNLLKGKGNIIEITGKPDESPVIDRHNGFMSIISKYPNIHFVNELFSIPSKPTDQVLEKQLKQSPSIDLIFALNDVLAFEGYQICKKNGVENKVKIIGIDGLPNAGMGMDMVANKYIAGTVLYPTGGQEAILTALNILEKKPYKKENPLVTTIIDSSNVRILKLQNQKVLTQQDDIDRRQKKIEEQILISNNRANIIVAISITLALALIFGGIVFYYLQENKKINKKLEIQKEEIATQRNQLVDLMAKVKEATDAKVNFFTNISHELRTPLTLILGPLDDSLDSTKLHFTIRNNLNFIKRNSMRLLRLINQLMDFRKIEEGKMRMRASENNLSIFVSDITHSFLDIAHKKQISLNFTSKANDLLLWFDVTMLDKVLFNLLSNAIKFTGENGTIDVTIQKSSDGKNAKIIINDSGVGMSPEDAQHAFEVFYQGHSSTFKGTGLGLSLSKELVSLHHGTIDVKSEKGNGTTFEINLPIGNSHLLPDEIQSENNTPINNYEDIKIYTTDMYSMDLQIEGNGASIKENSILIVEDNDDLRAFLKNRLREKYEIYDAESAEKGESIAFDIIPDLIISDVILPNKNGLQLTENLKHDIRTSHIPIILLTAKSSMEEQIQGIKSQADAFIVKPFNLEYLEESINTFLKNRVLLRDHYSSELPYENRSNSSNKIDRKFINEFTSIVEENLSNDNFSVEDLCKKIGISRVQLYRKVKALLGYNVNDYILSVRLQKAKFLLKSNDLPISEIAFQVGFSTQAYFSTVFKSRFSLTPSEYRDKKRPKNG